MSVKISVAVVDKSIKTLAASSGSLSKTIAELVAIGESLPDLIQQIAVKQEELDALTELTADTARRSKAHLELLILENKKKVLSELMKELGLAEITAEELAKLTESLELAQKDNAEEIELAVQTALLTLTQNQELATLKLTSTHEVEVSKKDAEIVALKSQIEYLTESNGNLNTQITEERKARVQTAEAMRPVAAVVAAQPAAR